MVISLAGVAWAKIGAGKAASAGAAPAVLGSTAAAGSGGALACANVVDAGMVSDGAFGIVVVETARVVIDGAIDGVIDGANDELWSEAVRGGRGSEVRPVPIKPISRANRQQPTSSPFSGVAGEVGGVFGSQLGSKSC
jgi:hypothetical protein